MKYLSKILFIFFAIPKTLYFNFKYLPFRQAVKLPILISHRVWLLNLSGNVTVSKVEFGAVRIGFGSVGIFDKKKSRTIWQVSGTIEFEGKAAIGHGCKLSVSGHLRIGDNFNITAESTVVAHNRIHIGYNVLISWDVLIMDSDHHKIFDQKGNQINPPAPVVIGNRVWIGCRVLILKGVTISDGSVVAAHSTVVKAIETKNCLIGGNPAKVIKNDISWQ